MNDQNHLVFSKKIWRTPMVFIIVIWFIYWIEITYGYNFNTYGIAPRNFVGIRGVFFLLLSMQTRSIFSIIRYRYLCFLSACSISTGKLHQKYSSMEHYSQVCLHGSLLVMLIILEQVESCIYFLVLFF